VRSSTPVGWSRTSPRTETSRASADLARVAEPIAETFPRASAPRSRSARGDAEAHDRREAETGHQHGRAEADVERARPHRAHLRDARREADAGEGHEDARLRDLVDRCRETAIDRAGRAQERHEQEAEDEERECPQRPGAHLVAP